MRKATVLDFSAKPLSGFTGACGPGTIISMQSSGVGEMGLSSTTVMKRNE